MKKQILVLVLTSVALWSCNSETKTVTVHIDTVSSIESDTMHEDSTLLADDHNAQNSLDWAGSYKGTTPCADCEGIETEITLSDDATYTIKAKYLGKDSKVFQENGSFSWDKTGSIIVLNDVKDRPSKFFVGENTLTQLDVEGKKITGALADKYVLRK